MKLFSLIFVTLTLLCLMHRAYGGGVGQEQEEVQTEVTCNQSNEPGWLQTKVIAPLVIAKNVKAAVIAAPFVIGKKILIGKKVLIGKKILFAKAVVAGKVGLVSAVVHHKVNHFSHPIQHVQAVVGHPIQHVQAVVGHRIPTVQSALNQGTSVISQGANLGTKVVSDTLYQVGSTLQDHAIRVQAFNGLLQNRLSQHGQTNQRIIQKSVQEPEPPRKVYRHRRDAELQNRQRDELQRLLRVVRQNRAEACLQRVLCELSVDMNVHGAEGAKFGDSVMKRFGDLQVAETNKYRLAADVGTQYKSLSKCSQRYEKRCNLKTEEILSMGNSMMEPHP